MKKQPKICERYIVGFELTAKLCNYCFLKRKTALASMGFEIRSLGDVERPVTCEGAENVQQHLLQQHLE